MADLGRGDLFAVKGRFRGEGTGLQGLVFAIADAGDRRIDRFTAIVANEGGLVRTDLHQSWRSFEEVLYTARFAGGIAQNLSREVQTYMISHLASDGADDFFDSLGAGRFGLAQEVVANLLGKVLGDGQVTVELAGERVTREEISVPETPVPAPAPASEAAPTAPGGEAAAAPAAAPQEVLIKVEPMLSPLRGMAASKLVPGQQIFVRSVETSEIGRHIARLTAQGLGVQENQIPVTVLSVQTAEYDRIRLRTSFGPGIVGISVISPELKVALVGADAAHPRGVAVAADSGLDDSNWPVVIAILVVVFLLWIAFRYLGVGEF